nr:hypothetical protein [Rickettsia endosymbiont of Ceutorhynchus assimilis]
MLFLAKGGALLHGSKKVPYVILAKSGNPENNSHPEFISGYINEMLKQVQHDKEKPGLPRRLRLLAMTGFFVLISEPCNNVTMARE